MTGANSTKPAVMSAPGTMPSTRSADVESWVVSAGVPADRGAAANEVVVMGSDPRVTARVVSDLLGDPPRRPVLRHRGQRPNREEGQPGGGGGGGAETGSDRRRDGHPPGVGQSGIGFGCHSSIFVPSGSRM